jgi:hypothetical protein
MAPASEQPFLPGARAHQARLDTLRQGLHSLLAQFPTRAEMLPLHSGVLPHCTLAALLRKSTRLIFQTRGLAALDRAMMKGVSDHGHVDPEFIELHRKSIIEGQDAPVEV